MPIPNRSMVTQRPAKQAEAVEGAMANRRALRPPRLQSAAAVQTAPPPATTAPAGMAGLAPRYQEMASRLGPEVAMRRAQQFGAGQLPGQIDAQSPDEAAMGAASRAFPPPQMGGGRMPAPSPGSPGNPPPGPGGEPQMGNFMGPGAPAPQLGRQGGYPPMANVPPEIMERLMRIRQMPPGGQQIPPMQGQAPGPGGMPGGAPPGMSAQPYAPPAGLQSYYSGY